MNLGGDTLYSPNNSQHSSPKFMNEGGNDTRTMSQQNPTGGLVPSDEEILEPPPKNAKPKVIHVAAATNLEDINESDAEVYRRSLLERPP